ncbi:hypothetical protein BDR07DRAFT_194888 [Suillus spraguei]|nr:hypothetical protein BDR07DRAFT_194888 [Suillus spraguei]
MVVAVPSPFKWDVKDSDVQGAKGIRILAHGTKFSLDLDRGNSANYTKVRLWDSVCKANQIWALTERVFEDQHTYSPRNDQGGTEDQDVDLKILSITTTMREAFIMGDLSTAEKLLTQEIEADARNHISYANRSLVMARKVDWDRALQNAVKSLSIQPSLIGYIAKGNALCGKQNVRDARTALDLTFTFANGDQRTTLLLFLIKAIALFNANEHEEAMMRVKELVAGHSVDPVACLVVEAYLQVQLGIFALDGKFYNEAVEAFTAAVKAGNSFADLPIHTMYEEFAVFFGWDLESLWQSANRQLCIALFRAGKYGKGLELYLSMMEASDEATKASTRAWFADFK